MIRLPIPPENYSKAVEDERNRQIETAFAAAYSRGSDVEILGGTTVRSPRLILASPNGTRYNVTVSNSGVLTTTAI